MTLKFCVEPIPYGDGAFAVAFHWSSSGATFSIAFYKRVLTFGVFRLNF